MSHQPQNLQEGDYVEKVRVAVRDLRIGMFVIELDRPWLETPFLFQGFELRTASDIDAVRQHCEFVYIDLLRTRVEHMTMDSLPPGGYVSPQKVTSFDNELKSANNAQKQTSSLIKTFADDIKFGAAVDIQLAKSAVSECVASILRNPDALMFMTRMRAKDESISQHAFNTCIYAIILGRYAGLDSKQLEDIGTCGLLHDVGMIEVPDEILNKKSRLTPEEIVVMQRHTITGRDILMSGRNVYSGAVDVAYAHHEHLDGTGYPRGLTGDQLNLYTRIIAVVDKYAALVSPRPFRMAYSHLDALRFLSRMARQNRIDDNLREGFILYLGIYPPGTIVELTSGEIAIVLESNPENRLRPRILVVRDAEKNPIARFVDMAIRSTDEQGRPYKIKVVRRAGDFGIDPSHYQNAIIQSLS
jgi:HD-GYP domain-containing protein (c-di-GMP phosphodiesterase class II)